MVLRMSHENAVRWMEVCTKLIDGLEIGRSINNRVAASLLHLSIEHQKAICVLVGVGNVTGSAFALVRPEFEAYIRGVWFNRCASEKQVNSFVAGNDPAPLNEQIRSIEKTQGFTHGALMMQKKQLWKHLNDYTHGGASQVKARNRENEIVSNYHKDHVNWLLNKSADISFLSCLEMAGVGKNHQLADNLLNAYREIYPKTP